jgi:hypothetical protein
MNAKNVTKQDVVDELMRLSDAGHSMKIGEFDNWLKYEIKKHFSGYKNAKKELLIQNKKIGNGRTSAYTDDFIRGILLECHDNSMTLKEVYEEYGYLFDTLTRRYGGRKQAFEMLGIKEFPRNKRESAPIKWTEEVIIATLKKLQQEYGKLSSNHLKENGYSGFVSAVNKRYGSWNAGIAELGFVTYYETPQFDWSKDRIKHETLKAIESGTIPTQSAISKSVRGYKTAIRKYFGNFESVKEYCGFCNLADKPKLYSSVIKNYRPCLTNLEGIKREIIRLHYTGCPLNYGAIRRKKHHLLEAAKLMFGTWKNAVEYCGIIYDDISITTNTRSECGYEFEEILGEILAELSIDFKKYAHNFYDPDFVLPDGEWIDAKLSEWTKTEETVKRYFKHCEKLTIVYLIGKKATRMRGRKNRYKMMSVYEFTDRLPADRRDYFNRRLELIEANASELGSHSA